MKAFRTLAILTFLILLISCGGKEVKVELVHNHVNLPTIQCGMCKSSIEAKVGKLKGVKSVVVDLENKEGHIEFDKATIKLTEVEKAIAAMGYQANNLAGNQEAYKKLPACCKIPE